MALNDGFDQNQNINQSQLYFLLSSWCCVVFLIILRKEKTKKKLFLMKVCCLGEDLVPESSLQAEAPGQGEGDYQH